MADKKADSFRVKVNDFEFTFTQDDIDKANISKLSDMEFHLLKNHRSINAEVLEADESGKNQVLDIEGEKYTVQIKDSLDQLLDTMGYSADTTKQAKEIKAPMPGLVLQVHVAAGQEVKEGDKLLVLVAMKMENSILSPATGIIKHVAVAANQPVEKGQLLVELA